MHNGVDHRVTDFLAFLVKQKVAGLVLYGMQTNAGPVLRMKSNQPDGVSLGVLKMIEGTDDQAVAVGAEALAKAGGMVWAELSTEDQEKYRVLAHTVLEAARARLAKSVSISGPGAPVLDARTS